MFEPAELSPEFPPVKATSGLSGRGSEFGSAQLEPFLNSYPTDRATFFVAVSSSSLSVTRSSFTWARGWIACRLLFGAHDLIPVPLAPFGKTQIWAARNTHCTHVHSQQFSCPSCFRRRSLCSESRPKRSLRRHLVLTFSRVRDVQRRCSLTASLLRVSTTMSRVAALSLLHAFTTSLLYWCRDDDCEHRQEVWTSIMLVRSGDRAAQISTCRRSPALSFSDIAESYFLVSAFLLRYLPT